MTRPIVSIRFAPGGVARIDEVAAEEGVKRSTVMDALVAVCLDSADLTKVVSTALEAEAKRGPHRAANARKGTSIRLDQDDLKRIAELVDKVSRPHQGRSYPDRSTAIRLLFHVGLNTPTALAQARRVARTAGNRRPSRARAQTRATAAAA